jgi:hypothetical protein
VAVRKQIWAGIFCLRAYAVGSAEVVTIAKSVLDLDAYPQEGRVVIFGSYFIEV